jgi:hypothetical protein
MSELDSHVCFWCGNAFTPRRDGGKRQVYCRPVCRRGFDAAGRRWVVDAIAGGKLTVAALRNVPAVTRALLPTTKSPAPDIEPPKPAPVASAEHAKEAVELLLMR